jgi:hypothetical protein
MPTPYFSFFSAAHRYRAEQNEQEKGHNSGGRVACDFHKGSSFNSSRFIASIPSFQPGGPGGSSLHFKGKDKGESIGRKYKGKFLAI